MTESYQKSSVVCGPMAEEYFCWNCGQLRLAPYGRTKRCGSCNSHKIEVGKPGELNKRELKKQWLEKD